MREIVWYVAYPGALPRRVEIEETKSGRYGEYRVHDGHSNWVVHRHAHGTDFFNNELAAMRATIRALTDEIEVDEQRLETKYRLSVELKNRFKELAAKVPLREVVTEQQQKRAR